MSPEPDPLSSGPCPHPLTLNPALILLPSSSDPEPCPHPPAPGPDPLPRPSDPVSLPLPWPSLDNMLGDPDPLTLNPGPGHVGLTTWGP